MTKLIIGIHGLSNKPHQEQLYDWWLRAINDGLKQVNASPVNNTAFKLAYWADLMYPSPDQNPEPYTLPETDEIDDDPAKVVAIAREFFFDIAGRFADAKEKFTQNDRIEGIKNAIREKFVKDLAQYYDAESRIKFTEKAGTQTKQALRAVLSDIIEHNQSKEILVIAHSMGSIIAYDVLRDLEGTQNKVSQFISIGSPLGLFDVKARTREEWDGKNGPYVPGSVKQAWINYADPKDLVSADLTLGGEYINRTGIDMQDITVSNGYCYQQGDDKKHNHHKSYGYLRNRELAEQLGGFLNN